ncbi:MAG: hypothetical protein GXO26_00705 [Crenarchaeota archaeon]|nr:hypothetical protein [Thermoproteota archaeon]
MKVRIKTKEEMIKDGVTMVNGRPFGWNSEGKMDYLFGETVDVVRNLGSSNTIIKGKPDGTSWAVTLGDEAIIIDDTTEKEDTKMYTWDELTSMEGISGDMLTDRQKELLATAALAFTDLGKETGKVFNKELGEALSSKVTVLFTHLNDLYERGHITKTTEAAKILESSLSEDELNKLVTTLKGGN